jgi:hypothetical protein
VDSATRNYPPGDLRVSDADRDRAVAELSEHFEAGRLTVEELDSRTGRALQARTGRELADLFADLPLRRQDPAAGSVAGPGSAEPSGAPWPHEPLGPPGLARRPPARIAIVLLAIAALVGSHGLAVLLVPVLAVVFLIRRHSRGSGGRGWERL